MVGTRHAVSAAPWQERRSPEPRLPADLSSSSWPLLETSQLEATRPNSILSTLTKTATGGVKFSPGHVGGNEVVEAALNELRRAVCDTGAQAAINRDDLQRFAAASVVALPVGGEGTRLRSVTDALGIQKNALRLPNGESLIERTIRTYRDDGFQDF